MCSMSLVVRSVGYEVGTWEPFAACLKQRKPIKLVCRQSAHRWLQGCEPYASNIYFYKNKFVLNNSPNGLYNIS
jgi:hypothetical protein